MAARDPDAQNPRCALSHRGFTMLGEPLFRRAEADPTPVMVVTLGERQVALPLRSLQREFGIADESPDGKMLAQIAAALEYVAALRLGDPLPREICSGEASWEPDATHLALANIRLRLQLVTWLNVGAAKDDPSLDPEALLKAADDPAVRKQVQEALDHAANALGLPSQEAVVGLLEDLARELAFVEALRERLLHRVQLMARKIEHIARAWRGDSGQMETLTQVRRLTKTALTQIMRRFEELDAQTGEVMATLRNADRQRAFIRGHRDWLYRSQLAWQPILEDWDGAGVDINETTRTLLQRTYRFLAPRFMPVTEWISANNPERKQPPIRQMMW